MRVVLTPILPSYCTICVFSSHDEDPPRLCIAFPRAVPVVSGKSDVNSAVIIPTENMTRPISRSDVSLDMINGQVIPPMRPIALADTEGEEKIVIGER